MPLPKDPNKVAEWKLKQSKSHMGERNHNFGKPKSIETRLKMSVAAKGRPKSEEHRKNLIKAWKTRPPVSEETKSKLRESLKGNTNSLGKKFSKESCRRISESKKGEKSYQWKGGISFEPYCPKFTNEFRERVRAFFRYCCVQCGKTAVEDRRRLSVHHVNFNKMACCDNSIPLFVSLCQSCHSKTTRNRIFWEYWFTEMINHQYDGKCYLSIQV